MPSNPDGTYLTFEKFESSDAARSRLQLPKGNDGRYRLEFDSQQVVDRIEIPHGDFGRADYLEPIAKDFPKYGDGGATQAITRDPFTVNKVVDLEKGRVIYESSKP